MSTKTTLAVTYHDPEGRMLVQAKRVLPGLFALFSRIAAHVTAETDQASVDWLQSAGVQVLRGEPDQVGMTAKIGRSRRNAVELALRGGTDYALYCDADRVLHWQETYPAELQQIASTDPNADFVVLGRTPRAFATHPRIQRDTETIINHVFGVVTGQSWDVTAAARLLSRKAAGAIFDGCLDDLVSTDASWPLFLQKRGGFWLSYLETEGLEFETADRYADRIAQAGGLMAWIDQLDRDPRQWVQRLELARIEVEALAVYR